MKQIIKFLFFCLTMAASMTGSSQVVTRTLTAEQAQKFGQMYAVPVKNWRKLSSLNAEELRTKAQIEETQGKDAHFGVSQNVELNPRLEARQVTCDLSGCGFQNFEILPG